MALLLPCLPTVALALWYLPREHVKLYYGFIFIITLESELPGTTKFVFLGSLLKVESAHWNHISYHSLLPAINAHKQLGKTTTSPANIFLEDLQR